MSSAYKIKELKDQIIDIQVNPFKHWLDEVLSICESEIEKQMFLQLTYQIQKILLNGKVTGMPYISPEISFIPKYIKNSSIKWRLRNDDELNFDGFNEFKQIGISADIGVEQPKTMNNTKGKFTIDVVPPGYIDVFRRIEIIPQYEVSIDSNNPNIGIDFNPRVDIAFILKRLALENHQIVDVRKLAIECDDYEFHKNTFEQDRIRTRALKQSGFKDVLRYSGSEIYKTSSSSDKIRYNFYQLLDIIMS